MRNATLALVVVGLVMACGTSGTEPSQSPICTPEEKKCDGNDVVKCGAAGDHWAFYKECDSGCKDGACVDKCTPSCAGKTCGDDGCGGTCGTCSAPGFCNEGVCCTPGCETADGGKAECGPDGCGGVCGECPVAAPVCDKGRCVPACTPNCADKECGEDGCGGTCGTCPDAAPLCEQGKCQAVCKPDCSGKECGGDGCGGSCGSCDAEEQCEKGVCKCVPKCDGKECGIDGCGGVCGKCTGQDVCQEGLCVCQPDCDQANCGADGCGGICGTCSPEKECVAGLCVCVPSTTEDCCGNAVCSFDSCGKEEGVLEPCPFGCADGSCLLPSHVNIWIEGAVIGPADSNGMEWDSFFGSKVDKELIKSAIASLGMAAPYATVLGLISDVWMKSISPPDPFGDAVPAPTGAYDNTKLVKLPVVEDQFHPQWSGKGWKDLPLNLNLKFSVALWDYDPLNDNDPMQKVVVAYSDILAALNAQTIYHVDVSEQSAYTVLFIDISVNPVNQCVPKCSGKQCGTDGCGGTCGVCQTGQLCSDQGLCIAAPLDECNGISFEGCCVGNSLVWCEDGELKGGQCTDNPWCGWSVDSGFYDCGTSGAAEPSGTYPLACPPGTCAPDCWDKQCGDDGCGGTCGECAEGMACQAGQCVTLVDECGGISWEGCCAASTLKYCDGGQLVTIDCSAQPSCGWSSNGNFYDCGTDGKGDPSGSFPKNCPACVPQCAGKQCGDNGCGGSCGTCSAGKVCQAGLCVAQSGCGSVTYEGCCTGNLLKYCDNGQLQTLDCSGNPQCGWNAQGQFYDCGTNGGADPTGSNPKTCSVGGGG